MVVMKKLKSDRKGQSAIEYLSTYGWALLAIVIVGAVLLQMGVFDQCNKLSPMFTGESIDMEDWDFVEGEEISMSFIAIDDSVTITEVEIDLGEEDIVWEGEAEINPGETEVLTTSHEIDSGVCASGSMTVTYDSAGIENRTAVGDGDIQGRVP